MSYLTITKPERCSTKFWETISKTLEEHCESEFDETSMEFHTLWDLVFVDVESSSSLDCLSDDIFYKISSIIKESENEDVLFTAFLIEEGAVDVYLVGFDGSQNINIAQYPELLLELNKSKKEKSISPTFPQ